jgi:hypothetical protein
MQTTLPVVMALTYPATLVIKGGIKGVLDRANRWSVLVPLATTFVTGLVNWAYFLPATNAVTAKRRQQGETCTADTNRTCAYRTTETKDGKRSWDSPPHSQEMVALNKKFGFLHGTSSLLNLISFISVVTYGFTLSTRLF